MKIWLINVYALPPGRAGSQRHVSLARGLADCGHQVTVVAGDFDHFSHEPLPSPGGKTARGSLFRPAFSFVGIGENASFATIPVSRYRGNGLGRLFNMVSFAWILWRLRRSVSEDDIPDVIVGSSLHLFGAVVARSLARKWGKGFVLEIRDIWPETLTELFSMPKWHPFVVLNRWMADSLYRTSREIVSTLPLAETHFRERGASLETTVTWIPNGCDPSRVSDGDHEERLLDGENLSNDQFLLTYAGGLSETNSVGELVEACGILKQRGESEGLLVEIIGDGPLGEKLRQQVLDLSLEFVCFSGRQTHSETQERLRASDAFALLIQPSPVYRWGYSMNKLADYLAAGRPIVVSTVSSYNPVEDAACGISYEAGNPEALADAILELRSMTLEERAVLGSRARCYAEENFDWKILARRLEDVIVRSRQR